MREDALCLMHIPSLLWTILRAVDTRNAGVRLRRTRRIAGRSVKAQQNWKAPSPVRVAMRNAWGNSEARSRVCCPL
jgi:hypothetical protein